MINKKLLLIIIPVIMTLLVPIILYAYNLNSVAFDETFYKKEFQKYNVYENLKDYDVERINNKVLNYLRYEKNEKLIDEDFFTKREKQHFLDVKNLFQGVFSGYYVSLALFLLLFIILFSLVNFNYKKITEKIFIILFFGSLLTLIDAFIFFILSNANFNFVFDNLHKIFFSIGTYTFNPVIEKIVVLYPESLFFDVLIKIITKTIFSSIIILFASYLVLFYFFKRNFFNFFSKFSDGKLTNRKL